MKSGRKGEPKPCPFCGVRLVWHEDSVDILNGAYKRYWFHPVNVCFLDRAEICVDDVALWNKRD